MGQVVRDYYSIVQISFINWAVVCDGLKSGRIDVQKLILRVEGVPGYIEGVPGHIEGVPGHIEGVLSEGPAAERTQEFADGLQLLGLFVKFFEGPLDVAHLPQLLPQYLAGFISSLDVAASAFQQSGHDVSKAVDVAAHLLGEIEEEVGNLEGTVEMGWGELGRKFCLK